MIEDFERCYRAVQSKDPRFDGWFFTAVTSTGIYCRPSCPAMTPKAENVRFYASSAAAQQAGFRACKRCRPDATPGSPEWDIRADVVARAMRLIGDGAVDRAGVPGLAAELGYSVRQLERMLVAEVGAGPLAIARAQRAQTARVLIETTELAMAQVAFGAGFASIRQFNDTVRAVFAATPSSLRARAGGGARRQAGPGALDLRLSFRQPLAPEGLFGHLAATAVPGVEEVQGDTYRRTLRLAGGPGVVALRPTPDHVACRVVVTDLRDLTSAINRCRWLLDLDADPVAVDETMGTDRALRAVVAKDPGRRVPRCVDGAELAIRAVVGQQVSTAAARTAAGRVVAARGERLPEASGTLTHLFPAPEALSDLLPPMPASRGRAFGAIVGALASGTLDLGPGCDRDEAMGQLAGIEGIGPWTAQVIAMRALGDPDAFPVTDLGVRRAADALGLDSTPAALSARAERWRPWRAYAVQYLWSVVDHPINRWPPRPEPTARHHQEDPWPAAALHPAPIHRP